MKRQDSIVGNLALEFDRLSLPLSLSLVFAFRTTAAGAVAGEAEHPVCMEAANTEAHGTSVRDSPLQISSASVQLSPASFEQEHL